MAFAQWTRVALISLLPAALAFACASSPPTSSPPPQATTTATLPPATIEVSENPRPQDAGIADFETTDGAAVVPEPTPPAEPAANAGAECKTDADCVPAECCHPKTCAPRDKAPECSAVMCTRECRAGTMDCGGGCYCQEGRCAARLGRP